jgi:hypothetical protein
VRAIILSLFLFSCTGDYVDTFWSKHEQVNSCFPSVKEYWESQGETIYFDDSGMEIRVKEETFCKDDDATACFDSNFQAIEIESWIFEYSDRYCDVVAHEIGHVIGYRDGDEGIMSGHFKFGDPPIIMVSK